MIVISLFTKNALPRWKAMKAMRDSGATYREIGAAFGVSLWAANKCINKLETYLLK